MKRIFDIIVSIVLLIILLPLIILISIGVKTTSKGPIFFVQKRLGRNHKEFNILKFRTMKVNAPNVATDLLKNPEEYITSMGRFLRSTSLDEIPQLFNILKGDMSFVGPRPGLYNQLDLKAAREKEGISKLVPGLTGWAQINGRDLISLEEKVRLDKEYMEKQSFVFDMKIIIITALKVIKREDICEGEREKESL